MSESEEGSYELDQIVDIKRIRVDSQFIIKVFIKWKNYTDDFNTWEPIENLNSGTIDFLQVFRATLLDQFKINLVDEVIQELSHQQED